MTLMSLLGHIEMGGLLAAARAAAAVRPIGDLVRWASGLAERWGRPIGPGHDAEGSVALAQTAARRMSRLFPGTTCLHRALATRIWLSRRGIDADIVVGFRQGAGLEGHAWLEVLLEGRSHTLFSQEGYSPSFREGELVESAEETSTLDHSRETL